jgi:hypothetical protein
MPGNPTLQRGNNGSSVKEVQRILGISQDGIFGRNTDRAVERFQKENNLYVDGVVGPITWKALLAFDTQSKNGNALQPWTKVKVTKYKGGYSSLTVRKSTSVKLELVMDEIYGVGGILTSSGGKRPLTAAVGTNRSKTSLHYTGRALDLYLWSGMINPEEDPFVIEMDDEDRMLWRVYAACDDGPLTQVTAWTYNREQVAIRRKLVDITKIFHKHGFSRIPARRSFFSGGSRGAAEWWHFQDIEGLVHKQTTFAEELAKVWPLSALVESPVWRYRDYTWANYGFTRG